jgi:drug/metabolite transporter (DMT)-like permease
VYFLIITSLLWAFSFGLIKHHLAGVDASFVAFARLALAAVLFLPWLRFARARLRLIAQLCVLGALEFGLMYVLYLKAFQSLQAYQVALLTIVTPIWVCLSEDLLRRTISWRPLGAAGCAIIGTTIALGGAGLGRAPWHGIILIQASNLCFAFGQVWYRRLRQKDHSFQEKSLFGWLYIGAVAIVLPLVCTHLPAELARLTLDESLVILYLGLIASGVGFFLWNYGASRVPAGVLAVMNNAKTPLGLVVSLVVFGESVRLTRVVVGGVLIVLATVYAQRASKVA